MSFELQGLAEHTLCHLGSAAVHLPAGGTRVILQAFVLRARGKNTSEKLRSGLYIARCALVLQHHWPRHSPVSVTNGGHTMCLQLPKHK